MKVNPKEILLDNILAVMQDMVFSKAQAIKVVGGEGKLLSLVADGKIEASKKEGAKNTMWVCNAAQVLAHCKNARSKRIRQTN